MPTRLLTAVVAGLALSAGFDPVAWAVLLPVGAALFFGAVRGTSRRAGALVGLVTGLVFFGSHLFWMRALGTEPWIALTLLETSFLVALGVVLAQLGALRTWPLWYAVAWVAAESLRGAWPFGGLTWGQLGLGVIDTPVAAWLPWIGSDGAGLVVAGLGASLAWLVLEGRGRAAAAVTAGAVLVVAAPGFVQPHREEIGELTVALVQGDVPGDGTALVEHFREVTRSQSDLTVALADDVARGRRPQPDLVVWPENSTAVDPFEDVRTRVDIERAVEAIGVPVLVGALADAPDEGQVLNQGIVYLPGTGAGERYAKKHPVPFGEYVPWRWIFRERFTEKIGLVRRDMVAGTRTSPLPVAGTLVADAICFDIAFADTLGPQVRRGATLGVVQTSNALFIHTAQVEQQFAISRVRAREVGRTVVVSSVNGRSGVIGAGGEVVAMSPTRAKDVLVQSVPLYSSSPPALVVGPWVGRVAVALVSIGLLFTSFAYGRGSGRRDQTAGDEHETRRPR